MDDRELLEMAAKAAAIGGGWGDKIEYHNGAVDLRDVWILEGDGFAPWNPLTDDGDALRLAVKLKLIVEVGSCWLSKYGPVFGEDVLPDPLSATRRAIVRAAAQIGRAM